MLSTRLPRGHSGMSLKRGAIGFTVTEVTPLMHGSYTPHVKHEHDAHIDSFIKHDQDSKST
jgi:hypothetical protein